MENQPQTERMIQEYVPKTGYLAHLIANLVRICSANLVYPIQFQHWVF